MSEEKVCVERTSPLSSQEQAHVHRRERKLQEFDTVLRQEAAQLRALADTAGATDADLAGRLHQVALRLDAIAWEIRSFDPQDARQNYLNLPGQAGAAAPPVEIHRRDAQSGEGTITDLGEGPEGTDTMG
ncbi:MAG TPA: hypothetical protein VFB38_16555 [Chthonomonadaceae bacterium]|nr:hypothetical protein [Chthonomonadaceae bacterium]